MDGIQVVITQSGRTLTFFPAPLDLELNESKHGFGLVIRASTKAGKPWCEIEIASGLPRLRAEQAQRYCAEQIAAGETVDLQEHLGRVPEVPVE